MFRVKLIKEYAQGSTHVYVFLIDGWITFSIFARYENGSIKLEKTCPSDYYNGNRLYAKEWGIGNDMDKAHDIAYAKMRMLHPAHQLALL